MKAHSITALALAAFASTAIGQSLPERGAQVGEDGTVPTLSPNTLRQNQGIRVKQSSQDPGQVVSPYQGRVDSRGFLLNTKAPVADRISPEELLKRSNASKPLYPKSFRPTEVEAERPGAAQPTVYDSSDILSDGRTHTILPKGAILNLPARYGDRIVEKGVGKLVLWPDFLKRNRSWLQVKEVTFSEASGETAWTEFQMKSILLQPRVTVAVLRKGPISVLQNPREAAEREAQAATVTSTTVPAE